MPRLLDCVPIPGQFSEIAIFGERVRLRANQLIIQLTITPKREWSSRPGAVPFPAILDTGRTHSLIIQEHHLVEWARLRPDSLPVVGAVQERGRRILLRAAGIWVHPNQRGSRDHLADGPPIPLGGSEAIAVYPAGVDFPRLPVLGLRAVVERIGLS